MNSYRSHAGSVLYLAINSRRNLCLDANMLSSHTVDVTVAQAKCMKLALKYLQGCQDVGMSFEHGQSN